ncbi:hypothetical protein Patl1_29263 [Pistacia atlantica]|uniref:Uncharacterized protein n=1 Tax=Pistacia atlantica TaxID=434234 RepID=A0ACC1BBX4_9ROSI|nr:hypothetical protein Patl1_29263 [Pistacia atlantica]
MANPGDSSHDKSVPEKGRDAGENESPGRERRDITPTPQVPGEEEGAKEVPGERERTVAPAAEGPVEKKRGRKDDAGASGSSGVEKKRKKGELLGNSKQISFLLSLWEEISVLEGCVWTYAVESGLQEQLAPTLLNIAQEPPHHESPSTSTPSSPKKDGGRKLDLNKPPPPEGGDGDGDGGAGSA